MLWCGAFLLLFIVTPCEAVNVCQLFEIGMKLLCLWTNVLTKQCKLLTNDQLVSVLQKTLLSGFDYWLDNWRVCHFAEFDVENGIPHYPCNSIIYDHSLGNASDYWEREKNRAFHFKRYKTAFISAEICNSVKGGLRNVHAMKVYSLKVTCAQATTALQAWATLLLVVPTVINIVSAVFAALTIVQIIRLRRITDGIQSRLHFTENLSFILSN